MSLMLQTLRQVEASAQFGPDAAASDVGPVPLGPPAMHPQPARLAAIESAVKAEAAPNIAACSLPAGDPYAALADSILAQLSPTDSAAVLLTSAGEGEGKTATMVRLATALAGRGRRDILAVDANLRNPQLAAQLKVQPDGGLAAVLSGTLGWRQAVRSTAIGALDLLPGTAAGDAVIDAAAWGALLNELRRHYRLVLVDGPSLQTADGVRLASCCDATYLVVRLGVTGRHALEEAAAVLDQGPGRLRGCVVID